MQEVLNIQHKLTKKWDNVKYWKKVTNVGGLAGGRAVCMVG